MGFATPATGLGNGSMGNVGKYGSAMGVLDIGGHRRRSGRRGLEQGATLRWRSGENGKDSIGIITAVAYTPGSSFMSSFRLLSRRVRCPHPSRRQFIKIFPLLASKVSPQPYF